EGETGRPEAQRVGGEIGLPALDRRLELGRAVPPVTEAGERALEVGEPVHVQCGLGGEALAEIEEPGLAPERARTQPHEHLPPAVEDVGAWLDTIGRVDDEVWVRER